MSPRALLTRVPTVATVFAAVLVVLPLLGSAPRPGAELALVVLAVGLAALAAIATAAAVVPCPVMVAARHHDDRPLPRGRATDTPHHPQAPRAPGRR